MTERPILFSAPMVRSILEGRKTQTRRVLRDQQPIDLGAGMHGVHLSRRAVHDHGRLVGHRMAPVHCPYGEPGDRLFVRERHCYLDVVKSSLSQFQLGEQNGNARGPDIWNLDVEYSDGSQQHRSVEGTKPRQTRERGDTKWRPSIHMPRWACRLVLEVTAVRIERLQAITSDDAIDEGIEPSDVGDAREEAAFNVTAYAELWDALNKKRGFGWDVNPWVWVVEFKRHSAR